MGARESFFRVVIEVTEENDGPVFLRKGPQETKEYVAVRDAFRTYGVEKIRKLLEAAILELRAAASHEDRPDEER